MKPQILDINEQELNFATYWQEYSSNWVRGDISRKLLVLNCQS